MQNKPKVLLIYPGDKSSAGAYSIGLLYVAKSLQKINIVIDKISYNNSYIVIAIFNLCPFPGTAIFELLNKYYNCQFPDSLEK